MSSLEQVRFGAFVLQSLIPLYVPTDSYFAIVACYIGGCYGIIRFVEKLQLRGGRRNSFSGTPDARGRRDSFSEVVLDAIDPAAGWRTMHQLAYCG
jgi:hypothetical protein